MIKKFPYLLTVFLLLPAVCFGDPFKKVVSDGDGGHRDEKLQAAFLKFPLLTPATNEQGEPAFQKLELNKPVNIDGIDFYGFRFQVSGRKAREDLVWAFVQNGSATWYILPQTGKMDGFENYFYKPRTVYQDVDDLVPVKAKELVTQRLSGDALEDDKYYVIWFAFRPHKPGAISLEFTFANVPPKNSQKLGFLEKILGLHRK
jgi:hypothetical protein